MRKFRNILFHLWLWIWALPSNIVGLVFFIFLYLKGHRKVTYFKGVVVLYDVGFLPGSASIGAFLFLWFDMSGDFVRCIHRVDCLECLKTLKAYRGRMSTLLHEYGHAVQNAIVGPLWLLIFGIPSLLWAWFIQDVVNSCRTSRGKESRSYYWFYSEAFANYLGGVYSFERALDRLEG